MGTIASHRVDAPTHPRTRFNPITRRYFKKMSTPGFPPPEAEPKGPSKASVGRDTDKVHAVEIVVEEDKPTLTEPCIGIPITNDPNTTEGSTLREDEARKKELTGAQVVERWDKADVKARSSSCKYCCIGFLVFLVIGIIGGVIRYSVRSSTSNIYYN